MSYRPRARAKRSTSWTIASGAVVAAAALISGAVAPFPDGVESSTRTAGSDLVAFNMADSLANDAQVTDPVGLSELRQDLFALGNFDGSNGAGVDVAIIDTGIAPVPGLQGADKVLHGPDLSPESGIDAVAHLDTYGHGTHMAGIIAGNRPGDLGIAPGARLVSVKVAGSDGVTGLAPVVAAIDWVIDHRNRDGLNIRVLNLSLGVGGVDSHEGDILSAAVERAWAAGIFVVVSAGNDGETQAHLDSPAIDPYVLAVGASDSTTTLQASHQPVPVWSALGDGHRNPDLIAPGRSIASYRVPGSTIDLAVPAAQYSPGLFLGSGTSQAAAAVSGLAARLIGAHPELDPDDVKATLVTGASDNIGFGPVLDGAGRIHTDDPLFGTKAQQYPHAAGPDVTRFVSPNGATWSGGHWSGATWSGGTWSGSAWAGATWSGATWSGATWSGATWSGATWSGATWSGTTWQ